MNIHQRINAVREKVSYIQKDKRVEGYMAVTHDAVTGLTRDHFIAAGVLIVPHELESKTAETGTTTAKGTPFIRFEAKYRIDFVNIDEPEQMVSVEFTSHALDHGDKAPGKAHSYAVKYAILKVLQLESGEGEENRDDQKAKKEEKKQTYSPTDGALENLSPERQIQARTVAKSVVDLWADEQPLAAYEQVYQGGHDGEFILAVWEMLRPHSSIRSALKKMRAEDSKQPQTTN